MWIIVPFLDTTYVAQYMSLAMKSSSYPQHWKLFCHKHSFNCVTSHWWSSFSYNFGSFELFYWNIPMSFLLTTRLKGLLVSHANVVCVFNKKDTGSNLTYISFISFSKLFFHSNTIGWIIFLTLHKRNRDCKLAFHSQRIRHLLLLNEDILSSVVVIFKLMLSWRFQIFHKFIAMQMRQIRQ